MPLAWAKFTTASAFEKLNWLRLAVGKLASTSYSGEEQKLTLYSIPFHAVLTGNLPKAVLDDGGQGIVVEMVVIDLGSKVQLSLGLELVVQASSTVAASSCRSRSAASGRTSWRVAS